jgi:isochorismate hydrolase
LSASRSVTAAPHGAAWRSVATAAQLAAAANEKGYELTIVTDAVTDTDAGAHLNSLRAIFPRIAELATTEEILAALAGARM